MPSKDYSLFWEDSWRRWLLRETTSLTTRPCRSLSPQEGDDDEEEDEEEVDTSLDVSVAADRSFIEEIKTRDHHDEDDEDENGGAGHACSRLRLHHHTSV